MTTDVTDVTDNIDVSCNKSSPAQSLNSDTVYEIFKYFTIPLLLFPNGRSVGFPWYLGHICSSWRVVFLSMKQEFWGKFMLVPNPLYFQERQKRCCTVAEAFLERNQGSPFSFMLNAFRSRRSYLSTLDVLMKESTRWQDVILTIESLDLPKLITVKNCFLLLRSLHLYIVTDGNRSTGPIIVPEHCWDIFKDAPHLTYIRLDDLSKWQFMWSSLLSLELVSHIHDPGLLRALPQMINLEELYLGYWELGMSIDHAPITLPRLKVLTIYTFEYLKLLTTPMLQQLVLGRYHCNNDGFEDAIYVPKASLDEDDDDDVDEDNNVISEGGDDIDEAKDEGEDDIDEASNEGEDDIDEASNEGEDDIDEASDEGEDDIDEASDEDEDEDDVNEGSNEDDVDEDEDDDDSDDDWVDWYLAASILPSFIRRSSCQIRILGISTKYYKTELAYLLQHMPELRFLGFHSFRSVEENFRLLTCLPSKPTLVPELQTLRILHYHEFSRRTPLTTFTTFLDSRTINRPASVCRMQEIVVVDLHHEYISHDGLDEMGEQCRIRDVQFRIELPEDSRWDDYRADFLAPPGCPRIPKRPGWNKYCICGYDEELVRYFRSAV